MNSMRRTVGWAAVVVLMGCGAGLAAEFHVSTAQELQNALTEAAGNGQDNTITLAAGYYVGNFNFNSAQANSLTIQAAAGVPRTEVTIDGDGAGRSMSLTLSGVGDLTVRGITVLRNCGATDRAGLRLSAGRDIFVDDCRFMAGATHQGIGVEIVAARDATLENSLFHGETGSQGRGLACSGVTGDATVQDNTFTGNEGAGPGGGASVVGGTTVKVAGNAFNANMTTGGTLNKGGGAYLSGGITVLLVDNSFSGNTSIGEGAGAYASGTTVSVSNNSFNANSSPYSGGGLRANGQTTTVNGNVFTQNSCTYSGSGGGAYVSGTDVVLQSNTFAHNTTTSGYDHFRPDGAGASVSGSALTLSHNVFLSNSAKGKGGGLVTSGMLMASNNTFDANSADQGGGVFASGGDSATLSRNIFRDNTATAGSGGGLYASRPTIQLFNNLFHNNSQSGTGAGGGAWLKATTLLEMVNNTLTANQAAGNGGGAFFQVDGTTEELHVFNNIIWGNTAAGNGNDVALAGTGSWKEFSYNCAHDLYGVWDRAIHNLDVAPVFFDPVNKNFRLRHTSPCINVGNNDAPNLPDTDLDGEARIQDVTVDLGAYEFSNVDRHPADLNDNWIIEESEYNAYAAAWKNDQEWSRGPNPIPADFVTRAGYLLDNGGTYHNEGSGGKPVCWKPGVAP